MAHIVVRGPHPSAPNETVSLGDNYFAKKPYTVSQDTPRRPLSRDVTALLSKAYARHRMAVRQADGFQAPSEVPAVTIHSVLDSDGAPWSASVTCGNRHASYTNWCGETFAIVFE